MEDGHTSTLHSQKQLICSTNQWFYIQ